MSKSKATPSWFVRIRWVFGWIGLVEPEYGDYDYYRARYSFFGSRRSQAAFERRVQPLRRWRSMDGIDPETSTPLNEPTWTE
jgi:hypothetical protein